MTYSPCLKNICKTTNLTLRLELYFCQFERGKSFVKCWQNSSFTKPHIPFSIVLQIHSELVSRCFKKRLFQTLTEPFTQCSPAPIHPKFYVSRILKVQSGRHIGLYATQAPTTHLDDSPSPQYYCQQPPYI